MVLIKKEAQVQKKFLLYSKIYKDNLYILFLFYNLKSYDISFYHHACKNLLFGAILHLHKTWPVLLWTFC